MQNLYSVSIEQTADLIATVGHMRTVYVQGHMGTGKTSLLDTLSKRFPDHHPVYFDCTTKDLGDLSIPSLNTDEGYVKYLPNEEFGLHLGKPVILMFDEFGKANPAVKNGVLRDMLDPSHRFPEGSIVFATSNLGAEGVGDLLPAHARNRLIVVEMRKPDATEWIEWGINNNMHPSVLGFAKEFPQVMQSFVDVRNPDDNPYIFHPKSQRAAFCTPRSLHAASDVLHQREHLDDNTLTGALIGTIGERGALDMMAFVKLADQLPSLESIKQDPQNATIPTSASAVCMVVYRAVSMVERDWVDAWITYLKRLDKEAQGLFVNCIRSNNCTKRNIIMQSKAYGDWAVENNYMFAADKK